MKNGADPEAIIAGARDYARQQQALGKIGTTYIAQAVTWLSQSRWSDHGPPANGHATGNGAHAPPLDAAADESTWAKRLTFARKQKLWSRPEWGPWPNEDGCLVPRHLIEPSDGQGWSENDPSR